MFPQTTTRAGNAAPIARGIAAEKARIKQAELELVDDDAEDEDDSPKPRFSTGNELAETADVMRVLASATSALSVPQIAHAFSQGRQIERRVALTILALARMGHLASTDGGETFMLRKSV